MNLRPYQERAVAAVKAALATEAQTLLVAPTGAGKTILMAAVARAHGGRVLVLQHRDELVRQNREKFVKVNRDWSIGTFDSKGKRFARISGFPGAATFAMVPTLSRPKGLAAIPDDIDLIMVDEAHHVLARTWRDIINTAREKNPACKVFGVTATPERSDGKSLGDLFKHCAEVISIGELIEGGYLVPPVARECGIGLEEEINSLAPKRGDFDMDEVARIIDHEPITARVIELWREHAGTRRTVIFCANVAHARSVHAAFTRAGISTGIALGPESQPQAERAETLRQLERGELQVVVNVYALTEGFDHQPVSCVVLLRPTCFRSTAKQMLGRGLRTVDPEVYPGLPAKTDCIVLDFGGSLRRMGGLEAVVDLGETAEREPGPPPMKPCPECLCSIPISARECPLCGYEYPPRDVGIVDPKTLQMRPLELVLKDSPFEWHALNQRTRIACSGRTWAIVFSDAQGLWHAFGAPETEDATRRPRPAHLASGTLNIAISRADDFMNEHGDPKRHGRHAGYLRLAPTAEQLAFATQLAETGKLRVAYRHLPRYQLSCLITASINRDTIRKMLAKLEAA